MNVSDAIPTSSSRNNLIVTALADNDGDPLSARLTGGAAERHGNRRRAFHQSGDEVIDGAATSGSQPAMTRFASRPASIKQKRLGSGKFLRARGSHLGYADHDRSAISWGRSPCAVIRSLSSATLPQKDHDACDFPSTRSRPCPLQRRCDYLRGSSLRRARGAAHRPPP